MTAELELRETATTRRRRVLVVEDNAGLARLIRFVLEQAGFKVSSAADGKQALDLVRRERFDLIVSDQQMPEMKGLDFCSQLRGLEGTSRVPFILLTAKALELTSSDLREDLGVVQVFPKPFSPAELVKAVKTCLALT